MCVLFTAECLTGQSLRVRSQCCAITTRSSMYGGCSRCQSAHVLLVRNLEDCACTGDAGDSAMRAAFEEVVAPAAHRFCPDIILVSCRPSHA